MYKKSINTATLHCFLVFVEGGTTIAYDDMKKLAMIGRVSENLYICLYITVHVFILKMNDRSRIVFKHDNVIVGNDPVPAPFSDPRNSPRDDAPPSRSTFGMTLMK